jgi:hypothetical protein
MHGCPGFPATVVLPSYSLENEMKKFAFLAALLAVLISGCATPVSSGAPTPYASPAGGQASPWMTAYGCDANIAARYGQRC